MRAVLVVVANILRNQSLQMAFVHCNDVVQQVAPTTLNPSLRDAVLPGTLERCPHRTDIHRPNNNRNFQAVLAISIENEKPRSGLIWEGLAQLLHDPTTGGMPRNIEMDDTPTTVTDDEEIVEKIESDCWHCEEVHGGNGFSMIAQKGEPAFRRLRISWRFAHPAGNGSFGNIETEHQELTVNPRRAPGRVLGHHTEDEIPYFFGNPPPPGHSPSPGDHTPIERESRSVPPHNGLRVHHD
jgi:hypothetical protein